MGRILNFIKSSKPIKKVDYDTKIWFLFEQTYQFFSDLYKMRIGNTVDIHNEIYARRDAVIQIKRVIKEKRVTRCFRFRVRDLIKQGRESELVKYGII